MLGDAGGELGALALEAHEGLLWASLACVLQSGLLKDKASSFNGDLDHEIDQALELILGDALEELNLGDSLAELLLVERVRVGNQLLELLSQSLLELAWRRRRDGIQSLGIQSVRRVDSEGRRFLVDSGDSL